MSMFTLLQMEKNMRETGIKTISMEREFTILPTITSMTDFGIR